MSDRFFCQSPITGQHAKLLDAEAHHLLHVMRLKPGARVILFDGTDAEFEAEITACGRREVELQVLQRQEISRERATPLVLGVALPKGDRQKVLVEKITELGTTRLVPLLTERSVAKVSSSGLEKLRRASIEACKQCQRNRLMTIDPPIHWQDFLAMAPADALRLIAHPATQPFPETAAAQSLWCAVGPEGGLADQEVAAAIAAGWQAVSLGPTILRIETAAIAFAARTL